MKSPIFVLQLFSALFFSDDYVASRNEERARGNRDQSAIADDIYEALIKFIEGEPLPPVKERTRAQGISCIRHLRNQGDLIVEQENGTKVIFSKEFTGLRGEKSCY